MANGKKPYITIPKLSSVIFDEITPSLVPTLSSLLQQRIQEYIADTSNSLDNYIVCRFSPKSAEEISFLLQLKQILEDAEYLTSLLHTIPTEEENSIYFLRISWPSKNSDYC